mmetsp:Transcript_38811/g.37157  ORF Transcript_38811/g.37157 Transcript_38811/m.37157 type:complete len:81 (+) Transcript_38811:413-655(+)
MEHIVDNQDCYSLNMIIKDEMVEDELPVNFVCGTSFYVKEVCMRPTVELNFNAFVGSATKSVDGIEEDNLLEGGGEMDFN